MNDRTNSDAFYRFAVAIGFLLALFALVWGRWAAGSLRDRLFSAEEQDVQSRLNVEEQRAETARVNAYRDLMQRSLSAEKDHSPQRVAFLTNEKERTERRLDRAQSELSRRIALAGLRSEQLNRLRQQSEIDRSRSDVITILGLALTILGAFLWYLRRQRHLDSPLKFAASQRGEREESVP